MQKEKKRIFLKIFLIFFILFFNFNIVFGINWTIEQPTAFYILENNANDFSGNEFHRNATNVIFNGSEGIFNGSAFISINENFDIKTVSFMFKINKTTAPTVAIMGQRFDGAEEQNNWALSFLDSGNYEAELIYWQPAFGFIQSTSDGYNDSQWHHGVIVTGVGGLQLYIDNVLEGSSAYTGIFGASPNDDDFSIGRVGNNDVWNYMVGSLKNIVVFENISINSSQVTSLFVNDGDPRENFEFNEISIQDYYNASNPEITVNIINNISSVNMTYFIYNSSDDLILTAQRNDKETFVNPTREGLRVWSDIFPQLYTGKQYCIEQNYTNLSSQSSVGIGTDSRARFIPGTGWTTISSATVISNLDCSNPFPQTFQLDNLTDGDYKISFFATDGIRETSTDNFSFIVDTIFPLINITFLENVTEPIEINQYSLFLYDFVNITVEDTNINFTKLFYKGEEIPEILFTPIEDRPVLGIKNYSGVSFDVSTEDTLPRSLYFKEDLWYLAGDLNNAIFEYYENGSYTGTSFGIGAQDTTPRGIFFQDGFWYLSGSQNDNIYQYYENWTYTGTSFDISTEDTGPTEIHFQDGFWYLVGNTNNAVFQYYENWTYTGISFDVSTEDTTPTGITFKDSFWYLSGGQNDNIYQYYENWTYTGISFDVSTEDTAPTGITFRNNFFGLAGDVTAEIYRYNTIFNETIFEFDEAGNQTITVFAEDLAGNNISTNISFFVNPFQYFRFENSSNDLITNFTLFDTFFETEAVIKLFDIGFGNITLEFEKQGFNSTNISLEFTNTSNYNLTIAVPISTIEITVFDITDFSIISGSNTTIEIIGDSFSQIYSTETGKLNISSILMEQETYIIIVSNSNYETSTINFNFNNQESITIGAYLTPTAVEEGVVADIIIRVIDDYQNPLRDLPVFQYVWDSGQSKYIQTNLKNTDYDGETSFKVFLNTKLYNFCAEYANILYCKNDRTININTEVVVIDIPISELDLPPENTIYDIDFSYSLTNSSSQIMGINYTSVTFNYNNPNQDVDEYCVKIYQIEQLQRTLVANQCDPGHSGGLSVNIIENTSNNYIAVATIEKDGSIRELAELFLYADYQLQTELDIYGLVKIIILIVISFIIGVAIHKKVQNIMIAHLGLPIAFLIFSIIFPIYISFQSFVLVMLVNFFAYKTISQKEDLKREIKFSTLNRVLGLYMIFIFGLHTALTEINEKGILDNYGEVILENIDGENSYFNSYLNTTSDSLKGKRADGKLGAWELLTGIFLKTLEFVDTFFSILSNLFNIGTTMSLIIGIKNALLLKFIKILDYIIIGYVVYLYFREAFK